MMTPSTSSGLQAGENDCENDIANCEPKLDRILNE